MIDDYHCMTCGKPLAGAGVIYHAEFQIYHAEFHLRWFYCHEHRADFFKERRIMRPEGEIVIPAMQPQEKP